MIVNSYFFCFSTGVIITTLLFLFPTVAEQRLVLLLWRSIIIRWRPHDAPARPVAASTVPRRVYPRAGGQRHFEDVLCVGLHNLGHTRAVNVRLGVRDSLIGKLRLFGVIGVVGAGTQRGGRRGRAGLSPNIPTIGAVCCWRRRAVRILVFIHISIVVDVGIVPICGSVG